MSWRLPEAEIKPFHVLLDGYTYNLSTYMTLQNPHGLFIGLDATSNTKIIDVRVSFRYDKIFKYIM